MQAADYHLFSGLQTPLTIFSALYVRTMTVSQLKEIADEGPYVKLIDDATGTKNKALEINEHIQL